MFSRLMRLIKAWIGYFVSFAEDPEVMLHQAIEEMRNTVPKLNGILVSTRATALKLEADLRRLDEQEAQLTNSIKAALREGSAEAHSIAEDEAAQLQQVRESLSTTRDQLVADIGRTRCPFYFGIQLPDDLLRRACGLLHRDRHRA